MAWDDDQKTGDEITASDWNNMVEQLATKSYVDTEVANAGGSGSPAPLRWGWAGTLSTGTIFRHEVRESCTIEEVYASVATASAGADIQLQVYKVSAPNATPTGTDSIFVSDSPLSITAGSNSGTGSLDSGRVDCSVGDVLIVEVTQVGSTTAGDDLYVVVRFV